MGVGLLIFRTPTFISDSKVSAYIANASEYVDVNLLQNAAVLGCYQLPELRAKKLDATNALLEPSLKHVKMIILLVKIRLFLLESKSLKIRVCTRILPLKLKRYSAGI